jgi:hypothetical protein
MLARFASLLTLLSLAGLAGCSASGGELLADDASTPGDDAVSTDDTATPSPDAPTDGIVLGDGAPPFPVRRVACLPASKLAHDLPTNAWGAIEAEIVSIVLPDFTGNCPADSGHVHLQIDVNGKRYDVAVNVESTTGSTMGIFTEDLVADLPPLGYSTTGFNYPVQLHVSSTAFTSISKADLIARLQTELANASRVSIHGLTYTDGSGIHDVHRNGYGHDGLILMRRNGVQGGDHAIALKFAEDVF